MATGGEPPPPDRRPGAARAWLEEIVAGFPSGAGGVDAVWRGVSFAPLSLSGLRVSRVGAGRALCTFRVPPHLADEEGNWQPGAIATVISLVGLAAIMTTEGAIRVSVESGVAFFSPAKIDEEVEIDARALQSKGRLTATRVVVRKSGGRQQQLVAVGSQWMAVTGRPRGGGSGRSSKL